MSISQVEVENKLDTFNYMTVKSLDCDAKLNIYCIGTTADEEVVQIQVIDDVNALAKHITKFYNADRYNYDYVEIDKEVFKFQGV